MKRRILPCLIALAMATAAHGAQMPEAAKKDARVRYATYDPDDVVTIHASIGMETSIYFEPGERITDMGGGDVDAWGLASLEKRDGIFLKPAGELPDTNIHVVTNKRKYTFDLKLSTSKNRRTPFMTVFFRYPADSRTAGAGSNAAKESAQVRALLEAGAPVGNRRYTVQGASDLSPIEAWDDGRTTFLRFRARGSIPAVYEERPGEKRPEKIENVSVNNDIVQVAGVRRKLVLRVGQEIACVFNEGYDADAPRPATNTASPNVKRTLKGAEQ